MTFASPINPDEGAQRHAAILARITEYERASLRGLDPFDVQLGIMQTQVFRDVCALQDKVEQGLAGGGSPLDRIEQIEAPLKNYLAAARRITRNANAALQRKRALDRN